MHDLTSLNLGSFVLSVDLPVKAETYFAFFGKATLQNLLNFIYSFQIFSIKFVLLYHSHLLFFALCFPRSGLQCSCLLSLRAI